MKGNSTLELAVLGLLYEHPMHGYELRKRLSVLLGPLRALSYGSLYPALKKLKVEGSIDESVPADNLVTRRAKRVYHLTDAGRESFMNRLNDSELINSDSSGFGVHLAFFSVTPSRMRILVLEKRRLHLEEQRTLIRKSLISGSTAKDRYSRELKELELESAEREIAWLNKLIAVEYNEQDVPSSSPVQ